MPKVARNIAAGNPGKSVFCFPGCLTSRGSRREGVGVGGTALHILLVFVGNFGEERLRHSLKSGIFIKSK
jgi:hypothetical protein